MSEKFEKVIASCKRQMKKQGIPCNEPILRKVAKGLGPSLYSRDSNLVASSDPKELERIKQNFIAKKLGVEGAKADKAIAKAIDKIGKSNRQKMRAVFYYLLVRGLGKSALYS